MDELRTLINATKRGPEYQGMSGEARSLCYRLASLTGLRYNEISSITPQSFNWDVPSVTVSAAYTKNGKTATLSLPGDLVADLASYVRTIRIGESVFCLPKNKGARLLRHDLKLAGIPYRDACGLFFDFHSLRCETATLLDGAGVSPRVVQKMMRHSSLELTGRYTRPRNEDIDAATALLPELSSQSAHQPIAIENRAKSANASRSEADVKSISNDFAHYLPNEGDVLTRNLSRTDAMVDPRLLSPMSGKAEENRVSASDLRDKPGFELIGAARIRTGDEGFADLCLTTWLRRQETVGVRRNSPGNHSFPSRRCGKTTLTRLCDCGKVS